MSNPTKPFQNYLYSSPSHSEMKIPCLACVWLKFDFEAQLVEITTIFFPSQYRAVSFHTTIYRIDEIPIWRMGMVFA